MKKNFTLFTITLCNLLISSHACAALISLDFDDITGNNVLWQSDRYLASKEILFEANDADLYAYDDPSPGHGGENVATSGLSYIYSGTPGHGNSAITVTFFDQGNLDNFGVTNFLQFDVVDYASENTALWSYRVFDINGDTLFSETGTASGETVQISTNIPLIHGFTFTPSIDTEGLDSLVFENVTAAKNASVPEPVTALLFGLGALGLLTRRKL
ncbi:PEP-CTERM sorting domain-containing protein [Thalassomonas actiniarum]|uniref:PEP-CTERM sorting domain-containing protein n=1 Tax=Thalassomonas actiniarum TaxID=485447 RepID=A0AAE9YWD7_9GAMM|nr:PEP-CTERM sorting domain-containing protein [Thalassomonas actiniarum]WDE01594.1 PEP-CTERM sorting domain-containing protein [Thalassomonas actiniarum]